MTRAVDAVRGLARDWGILTPLARVLAELPAFLDGEERWQGPLPVPPAVANGVDWLWSELAGVNLISREGA